MLLTLPLSIIETSLLEQLLVALLTYSLEYVSPIIINLIMLII